MSNPLFSLTNMHVFYTNDLSGQTRNSIPNDFSHILLHQRMREFHSDIVIYAKNCAIDVDSFFDMYQPDNMSCYTEANEVIFVYSQEFYSILHKLT